MQTREGWINHPFDDEFRKSSDNGKIRSIPIRVLFNDPDLNLRAEYSLFDRNTGRPVCTGNGDVCRRVTTKGIESLPCPSPNSCELSKGGLCKPYGRLNIQIADEDELGTFIFRTTGYNSIRSLTARLHYYQAVSGNLLACLPMELRIRGKSTTMSYRSAIYYVDITIREGMTLEDAIAEAKQTDIRRKAVGYDQAALDNVANQGFGNGAFEESEEEIVDLMDEFFPNADSGNQHICNQSKAATGNATVKPSLLTKLNHKMTDLPSASPTVA